VETMEVVEFCKQFIEVYSYKEEQQGRKICKWCKYFTEKNLKIIENTVKKLLQELLQKELELAKRCVKWQRKQELMGLYA